MRQVEAHSLALSPYGTDARRSMLEICRDRGSRQIDEEYIRAFDESRTIGPFSGFVEAGRGRLLRWRMHVALIACAFVKAKIQRLISAFLATSFAGCGQVAQSDAWGDTNANADVDADADEVLSAATSGAYGFGRYEAAYAALDARFSHQIGERDASGWRARAPMTSNRFMTYGPYTRDLAAGRYVATFDFIVRNLGSAKSRVLKIDVNAPTLGRVLAEREIQWFEFGATTEVHPFTLVFDNPGVVPIEFRIFWYGGVDVVHTRTRVRPIDEGKLGLLWNRQVGLSAPRIVPPSSVTVKEDSWYLFDRHIGARPPNVTADEARAICPQGNVGVYYSSSTDHRVTERPRSTVILPTFELGRPDACMVLDGTTFYDNTDARGFPASVAEPWHMLAQCLPSSMGSIRGWRMCHYTAPAPSGPWTVHLDHTVTPGSIWSQVCSGPGKSCGSARVVDEGTPDFLFKYNGYQYFSFHGYDGRFGYRGVARTRDFVTWETRGPRLPGDALFTSRDCTAYDAGCIGAGASSTLKSGDYYYVLVEMPTVNLACTRGQDWPFMLFRSTDLVRSGNWEAYPGNPFIRDPYHAASPTTSLCGLQYAQWIEDANGDIYLQYQDTMARTTVLEQMANATPVRRYSGRSLSHLIGRPAGADGWSVVTTDGAGFLAYGPYVKDLPQRQMSASFELAVDNNTADDSSVVRLDVYDATSGDILAAKTLYRSEMTTPHTLGTFTLWFSTVGRGGHAIETRVYVMGRSYVRLGHVEVR
ncbi:MAG: hypothetical protein H6729_05710 [Deltaproteobacteria bacterium]|nr:hypothetical protein [Deltaproteobacteria bacterium]